MYTNISIRELTDIIRNILHNNSTPEKQKQELVTLINTIINHNYLQFNNEYYKQKDGLAVGAPTSAILAEIFIQHLVHTHISNILRKHIIDYSRYVDDIRTAYIQLKYHRHR
jgi:hypothetical protein